MTTYVITNTRGQAAFLSPHGHLVHWTYDWAYATPFADTSDATAHLGALLLTNRKEFSQCAVARELNP